MTTRTSTDPDLAWLAASAPDWPWRWARTYAESAPHQYLVRDKLLPSPDYDRLFRTLWRHGQPARFYRRTMIELHLPDLVMDFGPRSRRRTVTGWKFWPMTNRIADSVVINSAPLDRVYGVQDAPVTARPVRVLDPVVDLYDRLAPDYDARYDEHNARAQAENAEIVRLCHHVFGNTAPTVLDLGAGTGLVLDLGITSSALYTAVDPSQGMLNQLIYKHPRVPADRIVPDTAEHWLAHRSGGARYQLVAALFGAGSYLSPRTVQRLPGLLEPEGMALIMHYRDGYLPDYETEPPPHYASSRTAAADLLRTRGGFVTPFNDFQLVVVRG